MNVFRVSVSNVFVWCVLTAILYLVIVPFSIMFNYGFNVPLVSGALRAIVLRASCFFELTTVDVLSPNVISSFEGVILPGLRVGLSSGAFLESLLSLHSVVLAPSVCGSFWVCCLYCTFSSVLESCSMSRIAAGVRTGCFSSL